MSQRSRKFVGVVATVTFLIVYCLIAMALGASLLVGLPGWLQLPGFVALGIGWLPAVMKIIRWMVGPVGDAG